MSDVSDTAPRSKGGAGAPAAQAQPNPPAPTPEPAPRRMVPLRMDRIIEGDFARPRLDISVSPETPYEHLFEPAYWADVGTKLRTGAIITAESEDRSWVAILYVRGAGRNWAQVEELVPRKVFPERVQPKGAAPVYAVKDYGSHRKFCVISLAEQGRVLREGFPDVKSANLWIENQLRAIGR
jgi:hypothetical protein